MNRTITIFLCGLTIIIASFFLFNFVKAKNLGATICYPYQGCTGTSTAPTAGQLLRGKSTGVYELLATSTDGAVLSLDTNGYPAWAATSSLGVVGIVSTSTVPTISQLAYWTSAGTPSTLGTVATTSLTATSPLSLSQPISVIGGSASALSLSTAGDWTGTFDSQEGSYYLNANNLTNFGTPFWTFFNATTTTALAEGNNLYWTNNRFDTRLAATTTLPQLTTLSNLTTVGALTSGSLGAGFTDVPVLQGGTGLSSFTASSLLYSNSDGTALAFAATSTLNIGGNAGTATALASNPADCGANTWATTIAANGDLTCSAITYAGITAMTSANFAGLISDETGTAGKVVFDTSPTLITPILGYASSTQLTTTNSTYLATEGGNVGIGTTEPADRLDIAGGNLVMGPLNSTGLITFRTDIIADTNTGISAYDHSGSNNDGLALYGGDGISFHNRVTTGHVEYMRITSSGNVGIGTTSPGSLFSLGNTGANTINISATATSTFGSGINVLTGCFAINGTCVSGGGSGTVNSGTAGQIPYYAVDGTAVSATSSIIIASSQYVGIGTTTPNSLLSLYQETGDVALSFGKANATMWTIGVDVSNSEKFKISSSSALGTNDYFTINKGGLTTMVNASTTSLSSSDNTFLSTGATKNTGIGIGNPLYKLHVEENEENWAAYINNTHASAYGLLMDFTSASGATEEAFAINTGVAGPRQFTVRQNGKIGIGSSSPNFLLSMEDSGGGYYNEATHTWVVGSTRESKQNIIDLNPAIDNEILSILDNIQIHKYKFKPIKIGEREIITEQPLGAGATSTTVITKEDIMSPPSAWQYGVIADELPTFLSGQTKTGLELGPATQFLMSLAKVQNERIKKLENPLGGFNQQGDYIVNVIDKRIDEKKEEIKDYVIQAIQDMSFTEKIKLFFK